VIGQCSMLMHRVVSENPRWLRANQGIDPDHPGREGTRGLGRKIMRVSY
jgi:hypothetical protein